MGSPWWRSTTKACGRPSTISSPGGTYVVTLVSDVPGSRRHHYIGIDNVAAGRTAGSLMGRFVRTRAGKIGVIAGSQSLRDHAERIFGFNQVMSLEYPQLSAF